MRVMMNRLLGDKVIAEELCLHGAASSAWMATNTVWHPSRSLLSQKTSRAAATMPRSIVSDEKERLRDA